MLSAPAFAVGTHYYISSTVDTETWLFLATVIEETSGAAAEAKRVPQSYLSAMQQGETLELSAGLGESGWNTGADTPLVLTFPGSTNAATATNADRLRAQLVVDKCFADLNRLIAAACPDRSEWTSEFFCEAISMLLGYAESGNAVSFTILPGGTPVTLSPCTLSADSEEFLSMRADQTVRPSDYIVLREGDYTTYLLCRIPKGYREYVPGLASNPVAERSDPEHITWRMLAWEAIHNRSLRDASQVNSDNYSDTGSQYVRNVTAIVETLTNALRGLMNLWTVDELVFGSGGRNETVFLHGMFPLSWESYIWAMYALFELIAVLALLYGIIRLVATRALTTANVRSLKAAWDNVYQAISFVLLLLVIPFVVQILFSLSSSLSSIAMSILGESSVAQRRASIAKGGGLGGMVTSLLIFAMDVYFNFFYSLRMVTLAALIAIAPLCVALRLFGNSRRQQIYTAWMNSLLVNIFIQPIHAFLLAFICVLPAIGGGFIPVLLMYSVLPVTTTLRDILFRGAGGENDTAATGASGMVTGSLFGLRKVFTRLIFPFGGGVISLMANRIISASHAKDIRQSITDGTIFRGTILGSTRGGYRVASGSSTVYIRKSDAERLAASEQEFESISRSDLEQLSEEEQRQREIRFQITDLDSGNHIRGSADAENHKAFMDQLSVGQTYNGIVKKVTERGIIVNIGTGVSGFVPKRELLTTSRDPSNFAKTGDILPVRVTRVDSERERVSLTIRLNEPWSDDPWQHFVDEFRKGDVTEGVVVKTVPQGAVIELAPGVTGFIPNSLAGPFTPGEDGVPIFSKGDRVAVAIRKIDEDTGRIRLSAEDSSVLPGNNPTVKPNGFSVVEQSSPISAGRFWSAADRRAFEDEYGRAPTEAEVSLFVRNEQTSGDPAEGKQDFDDTAAVISQTLSDSNVVFDPPDDEDETPV